jgi:deoxyribonuclease V
MKIIEHHRWDVSYREAVEIQDSLRHQVILKELSGTITSVAGLDVSVSKKTNTLWAGVVVMDYPQLKGLERKWIRGRADFPYVPGLLSFREVPVLIQALRALECEPDVILCDGQGIAHPRGLGLASHLGILTSKPTIGCAKKRLVGTFSTVGPHRRDYALLNHRGRTVGAVVRTKANVKPLFISPGHAITLEQAMEVALNCTAGYRIPEPLRQAHHLVNRIRRESKNSAAPAACMTLPQDPRPECE